MTVKLNDYISYFLYIWHNHNIVNLSHEYTKENWDSNNP